MAYVVIVTDAAGAESRSSFRRFSTREAAEAWARRMIVNASWRVEPEPEREPED
jgi:hypothetical protein